jgi:hypothetical protein
VKAISVVERWNAVVKVRLPIRADPSGPNAAVISFDDNRQGKEQHDEEFKTYVAGLPIDLRHAQWLPLALGRESGDRSLS